MSAGRITPDGPGRIVGAALVAHVPTIVLPQEIRFEINEGKEISLVPGLHRFRREVMDKLDIDTVIVFDTHWFTTLEFVIASHESREGFYTSDELPRGMKQMPFRFDGDPELAHAIAARATDRNDMWITPIDDPYLPVHYPTINLLPFLQRDERWVSIGVCQTGELKDFLLVGELIAQAVAESGRRVMLLASGAMSHTFYPLQELRQREASDPKHIFTPEARAFDERILSWWASGDHASVIDAYPEYRRYKPEGRFGHYLMMIGALGGRACTARGVPYSEYENAVGTAQIHVNFELRSS